MDRVSDGPTSTRIVLYCADELRVAGIRALFDDDLRELGILVVTEESGIEHPDDIVIVFPEHGGNPDRFRSLQRIPLDWLDGGGPFGVAVCRQPVDLMVALRFVESGISYVIADDLVARSPEILMEVARGSIDEAYQLPTPWELRDRLGLRWAGNMREFCSHVGELPAGTWIQEWKQNRLPISRRQIYALRTLARDVAGLPEPDARRYSTTVRSAPLVPEWHEVRQLVHRLWGLNADPEQLYF